MKPTSPPTHRYRCVVIAWKRGEPDATETRRFGAPSQWKAVQHARLFALTCRWARNDPEAIIEWVLSWAAIGSSYLTPIAWGDTSQTEEATHRGTVG